MALEREGTPYVSGGPLASSLREWVRLVWPQVPLRRRTVLEAALARLREGFQLAVTPTGEAVTEASSSAAGSDFETCYHGCNPRCLALILQTGLLPNKGRKHCPTCVRFLLNVGV